MASPITSLTIVYSTFYSGVDRRKHQSSASLAFVRGIHRWPVNSPHKWPVTRKMFLFDDVIMSCTCFFYSVWLWLRKYRIRSRRENSVIGTWPIQSYDCSSAIEATRKNRCRYTTQVTKWYQKNITARRSMYQRNTNWKTARVFVWDTRLTIVIIDHLYSGNEVYFFRGQSIHIHRNMWGPYVAKASAAMILTMQNRYALVLLEEGFQLPLPYQCWEMT